MNTNLENLIYAFSDISGNVIDVNIRIPNNSSSNLNLVIEIKIATNCGNLFFFVSKPEVGRISPIPTLFEIIRKDSNLEEQITLLLEKILLSN